MKLSFIWYKNHQIPKTISRDMTCWSLPKFLFLPKLINSPFSNIHSQLSLKTYQNSLFQHQSIFKLHSIINSPIPSFLSISQFNKSHIKNQHFLYQFFATKHLVSLITINIHISTPHSSYNFHIEHQQLTSIHNSLDSYTTTQSIPIRHQH